MPVPVWTILGSVKMCSVFSKYQKPKETTLRCHVMFALTQDSQNERSLWTEGVLNHPPFLHVCVWGRKCGGSRAPAPLCLCVSRHNIPSEMALIALVQLLKVGKQRALLPNYTDGTFCCKCQWCWKGQGWEALCRQAHSSTEVYVRFERGCQSPVRCCYSQIFNHSVHILNIKMKWGCCYSNFMGMFFLARLLCSLKLDHRYQQ